MVPEAHSDGGADGATDQAVGAVPTAPGAARHHPNAHASPGRQELTSTYKSQTPLCRLVATSPLVRSESASELTLCQSRSIYEWISDLYYFARPQ